ncbi:virB8 family protein [Sphingomonas sp. DT-204]|uniref:virB8 family protein n=1 Tax=Sphingomonas sp. DT-204 TaxID=3396166 RepID=UPI003F1C43C1
MSKKDSRAALDAYYAEADSWAFDRQTALRRSRSVAWIVAAVACVIAVCEALALVALMPLKSVVPYTLLVDRQTGFVQALKPVDAQLTSSDAALTQSFLVQYVIAREGFDIDSLQRDYRKVALWSAGDARRAYVARMQAGNPDSPLARYPRSAIVDVRIKSVTSMGPHSALVRFETQRRDAGGRASETQPWIAVIRYSYSGEPMSLEDRLVNPLGFKVERYRRSAETLPLPETQVQTNAATTPAVANAASPLPSAGAATPTAQP